MNTWKAVWEAIPGIIATIKALESAIPLPGQGRAKAALIIALVEQLSGELHDVPVDKLKGIVTNVISTVVALFNSVGLFKKATA